MQVGLDRGIGCKESTELVGKGSGHEAWSFIRAKRSGEDISRAHRLPSTSSERHRWDHGADIGCLNPDMRE